jgi:hypothetical protein
MIRPSCQEKERLFSLLCPPGNQTHPMEFFGSEDASTQRPWGVFDANVRDTEEFSETSSYGIYDNDLFSTTHLTPNDLPDSERFQFGSEEDHMEVGRDIGMGDFFFRVDDDDDSDVVHGATRVPNALTPSAPTIHPTLLNSPSLRHQQRLGLLGTDESPTSSPTRPEATHGRKRLRPAEKGVVCTLSKRATPSARRKAKTARHAQVDTGSIVQGSGAPKRKKPEHKGRLAKDCQSASQRKSSTKQQSPCVDGHVSKSCIAFECDESSLAMLSSVPRPPAEYGEPWPDADMYLKLLKSPDLPKYTEHPGWMYTAPKTAMYLLKCPRLLPPPDVISGQCFGFPRLKHVKKNYLWKKMSFTTDMPKSEPKVRYITASCHRGDAQEKHCIFRLHAVMRLKDGRVDGDYVLVDVRKAHGKLKRPSTPKIKRLSTPKAKRLSVLKRNHQTETVIERPRASKAEAQKVPTAKFQKASKVNCHTTSPEITGSKDAACRGDVAATNVHYQHNLTGFQEVDKEQIKKEKYPTAKPKKEDVDDDENVCLSCREREWSSPGHAALTLNRDKRKEYTPGRGAFHFRFESNSDKFKI